MWSCCCSKTSGGLLLSFIFINTLVNPVSKCPIFSLLFVYKRFLFRYLTMVKIFLWEMCPKRQMRKNSGHSLASMAQSQNAPSSKTANKAIKTQSWEKPRLGETACHECREAIRWQVKHNSVSWGATVGSGQWFIYFLAKKTYAIIQSLVWLTYLPVWRTKIFTRRPTIIITRTAVKAVMIKHASLIIKLEHCSAQSIKWTKLKKGGDVGAHVKFSVLKSMTECYITTRPVHRGDALILFLVTSILDHNV